MLVKPQLSPFQLICLHEFNPSNEKQIECILFALELLESKIQPTIYYVSQVLYIADKQHLNKYGRPISSLIYYASNEGPLHHYIYGLMNKEIYSEALQIVSDDCFIKLREPHIEFLSDSDIECIKHAVNLPIEELNELSRDNAWRHTNEDDVINVIDIINTLSSGKELLEYYSQFPLE